MAAEEEADELWSGAPDPQTLERWTRRREAGEPLAWIVGVQRFCGRDLRVHRGVFVPRPQSEELARRAAAALGHTGGPALDVCTGAGAIAAHLMDAVPGATIFATDVDAAAVRCARANGVRAVQADLAQPFVAGICGVVTAVAPYVPTSALALLPTDVLRFEPRRALDGGGNGLDVVRRVVASAARVLRPGGHLFVELGGEQAGRLAVELDTGGWNELTSWGDAEGDLRGLSARRPPSIARPKGSAR